MQPQICLDHTRTEKRQFRAIKASKARMSCFFSLIFFLISISSSLINLLENMMPALVRLSRAVHRFRSRGPRTLRAYLRAGRGVPSPPLAACQVLVENGSTPPGRKRRRRRRRSPFIGQVIRRPSRGEHHYHHMEPKKCSWDCSSRSSITMG